MTGGRRAAGRHRSPSFAKAFTTALAVLVLATLLWSVATPLNGGPDERNHVMKAAAVVRGQAVGDPDRLDGPGYAIVHVPEIYTDFGRGDCVQFRPRTPAGVCPVTSVPAVTVAASTYVSHYPPFYYAVVGWPTFLDDLSGVYGVRLVSLLLSSSLLALAFAAAVRWSRSAWMLPALMVAVSPMVLFTNSVVNGSSVEISAAVLMWTASALVVFDRWRDPPPALVLMAAGAAAIEMVVRVDSPLWVALCVLVFTPFVLRSPAVRSSLAAAARRPSGIVGLHLVVAGAGAAGAWLILGHATDDRNLGGLGPRAGVATLLRTAIGKLPHLLDQAVGNFGWTDTPAPSLTFAVWVACGAGIVLWVLVAGRPLARTAVLWAGGLSLMTTVGVLAATLSRTDLGQGRYFLPAAVAVPIVAGAVFPHSLRATPAERWFARSVAWLTIVAQVAAAYGALRRYAVGIDGPIWPWQTVNGAWRPPLPATVLDAGFLTVGGIAAVVVSHALRYTSSRTTALGNDAGSTDQIAMVPAEWARFL